MQDRPVPHDQIQAPFVSILALLTYVHPSPFLVPFGSAGACSLFPHLTPGEIRTWSPRLLQSQGARAELWTVDSAILPLATRGCTRTIQLSEGRGRGCGWTHCRISSASLCSICLKPLSPWDSALGPASLTQVSSQPSQVI